MCYSFLFVDGFALLWMVWIYWQSFKLVKAEVNKEIIKWVVGHLETIETYTECWQTISKLSCSRTSGHFGSIEVVLHPSIPSSSMWEAQEVWGAPIKNRSFEQHGLNVSCIVPAGCDQRVQVITGRSIGFINRQDKGYSPKLWAV